VSTLIEGLEPLSGWRAEHWPELRDAAAEVKAALTLPVATGKLDRDSKLHTRIGHALFRLSRALVQVGELFDEQADVDRSSVFDRWNAKRYKLGDAAGSWAFALVRDTCNPVAWHNEGTSEATQYVKACFENHNSPSDGSPPSRRLASPPFFRDVADRINAFLDALVLGLKPIGSEPESEAEVANGLWEFMPGSFRYGNDWHEMTPQGLRLLEAFSRAKRLTLTHTQIKEAATGEGDGDRHYAYVADLNKALRKCWKLPKTWKPVVPIRGAGAYRLRLPENRKMKS